MHKKYEIIRFYIDYKNYSRRVIHTNLTLKEAQAHCNNIETSSSTCVFAVNKNRTKRLGPWFDGYTEE